MSLNEPESYMYAGGRCMVRDQTKSSLPILRVMRLGCGLIPHSYKNFMETKKTKNIIITETMKWPHNPQPLPCGVTRVMMMSGPPSK